MTEEEMEKEFERQHAAQEFTDGFFFRESRGDKIWWVETVGRVGELLFSFDKKTVFNFFRDYPQKLTKRQIEIFQKENPELAKLK